MSGFCPRLPAMLVCALAAFGCGDDESNPPPLDIDPPGMSGAPTSGDPTTSSGTSTGSSSSSGGSSTGEASDSSSSTGPAVDDTGTTTGGPLVTCEELACTGSGACEIGEDGNAQCVCDPYYVLDEARNECVVDETCVRVRYLEEDCRQMINGPSAVSLFFGVDFCAGSAVTPDKLAELGIDFVVLEDGVDVTNNVEYDVTLVPTSVESYVTLVVDVSESVIDGDLPALVSELRNLVSELEPAAGDPDVYVSVYVFGRYVREYVPFTRDFGVVDTALAQIETDPASVVSLVSGAGTALYDAVAKGIDRTQRIRELRDAVTWGGVLTTGTVVVITDGDESTGGSLDVAQIDSTLNQVISIGTGMVDRADLDAIGRDGSFLAPTSIEWPLAFADVATRVDQYPDRAYLLAYCSSLTQGMPSMEITVTAPGMLTVEQTAVCEFNADVFSSDPGAVCNQDLFFNECTTQACGGLTACGACADTECCDGSSCSAPVSATQQMLDCGGSDQLCNATGEICVVDPIGPDLCEPPAILAAPCDEGCEPGIGWCDAGDCAPALSAEAECNQAIEGHCATLNCQKINPLNPFEPPECLPPALVFDRCDPISTVCEDGSYCAMGTCAPSHRNLEGCDGPGQCRSGLCEAPLGADICVGSGACFWAWDEKVP